MRRNEIRLRKLKLRLRDKRFVKHKAPVLPSGSKYFNRSWLFGVVAPWIFVFWWLSHFPNFTPPFNLSHFISFHFIISFIHFMLTLTSFTDGKNSLVRSTTGVKSCRMFGGGGRRWNEAGTAPCASPLDTMLQPTSPRAEWCGNDCSVITIHRPITQLSTGKMTPGVVLVAVIPR